MTFGSESKRLKCGDQDFEDAAQSESSSAFGGFHSHGALGMPPNHPFLKGFLFLSHPAMGAPLFVDTPIYCTLEWMVYNGKSV